MEKKPITKLAGLALGLFVFLMAPGCAQPVVNCKSCSSCTGSGIYREVKVYAHDGRLIGQYKGVIYIQEDDNNRIVFYLDGNMYIYYNAIIAITESKSEAS